MRAIPTCLCLVLLSAVGLAAAQDESPHESELREDVEVSRFLIDVRVIDPRTREPIPDLDPGDFVVRVDGEEVEVASADWYSADAEPLDLPPGIESAERPGRTLVLMFQRHTDPSRITGLMKVVPLVEDMLESLGPDDRVAVLSLGTRLDVYTDLTSDFDAVGDILRTSIVKWAPPPDLEPGPPPSLVAVLQGDVSTAEAALIRVGESLADVSGTKALWWFGWGMATDGIDDYGRALAAMRRSRVAVFNLDITQANWHSLEGSLREASRQTGGFYASTYEFPALAVERAGKATGGYYVLGLVVPRSERTTHRLKIRLRERDGTVYHPDHVAE